MDHDYIDPAFAIPVALILLGLYILQRLFQSQKDQAETAAALARIQHAAVFISAVELWGTNPGNWPSEVRDALGVSL